MISQNIKKILYLAHYAFKAKISAKYRMPLLCSFKITYRCNLKCLHCPFWSKPHPAAMEPDKAEDLLHKLYLKGIRLVIFEGGEPLLYPAIGQLIEKAKDLFFSVGITTNGTLDLDKADPDIYFISIDGLKEVHESIRGKSFDLIMENIKRYRHKKIIANITISGLNHKQIGPLIEYLEDKVYGFTIQFFYPFPGIEELQLTAEQRISAMDTLIALKRKGYSILDSYTCLHKMKDNSWRCHDFLVASIEPDGSMYHGCYLKHRLQEYYCRLCGYAVHCEASSAYDLAPDALKTAKRIFLD